MLPAWENLSDAIFHHAERRPQVPALVEGPTVLSYREFAAWVGAASRYLRGLGVEAGDRVGLILDNHADHFILAFALMRIGATPIEIPTDLPPPMQDAVIQRCAIKALFLEYGMAAGGGLPLRVAVGAGWRRALEGHAGDARCDKRAGDNRLVILTSGSSGPPKATVTTHRQRLARAPVYAEFLGGRWTPDDPGHALLKAPVSNAAFHEFAINQILFGGTLHILPGFDRLNPFARALAAYEDAVCFATANMCRALLASCDREDGPFLPRLRALVSLGLPLSPAEKRALRERVTPEFHEIYGASGFGMISGLRPGDIAAQAGTVGRAAPGAVLEVVDAAGVRLASGATGHLRCRGATVAEGFLLEEDAARGPEAFREGWYYPGDLAAIDAGGWVHLKGRKTDLIVRAGVEIYPYAIEAVLMALPGIKEAAVIGLPAKDGPGEEPVAVVVADEPLRHEFLASYCAVSLPPEQRPLGFLAAPSIKKTSVGKIDRPALRAQVEALLEAMRPAGGED
ncbi:class I adenylate-forming enzyme family protein [Methylomagnum ishizawai]|uniref:class I adenylate-forming enzyme family protein n=1 Tax=Methylomagnum ishizawai TaxID=1760988 RepID=UPI001C32928C|nr:class I adenylate-forming enzyme family protein [Methylomagnum ishizawai]BBL72927.1 fatty-acyl-CoA synthase [Methylomagnum ishizawai]